MRQVINKLVEIKRAVYKSSVSDTSGFCKTEESIWCLANSKDEAMVFLKETADKVSHRHFTVVRLNKKSLVVKRDECTVFKFYFK